MERLRRFLMIDDARDEIGLPLDSNNAIELDHVHAVWPLVQGGTASKTPSQPSATSSGTTANDHAKTLTSAGPSQSSVVALNNVHFSMAKGELVGVCGAVGAGKSSLLAALLAQTRLQSGAVRMQGSVAYVAQQAWIQSMTLRDNILFGTPYEAVWYNQVVDACCLLPDFQQLPAGEFTEIGERGGFGDGPTIRKVVVVFTCRFRQAGFDKPVSIR